MADSKAKKHRKQSPDFPLSFHKASGNYCKKVDGKRYYFGHDPDEALARWKAEEKAIREGVTVKPAGETYDLKRLCNEFLTNALAKRDGGELSNRSFQDYLKSCEQMVKHLGKTAIVQDLTPTNLMELRRALSRTMNTTSLGNEVGRVRVILRYAFENGLTEKPVKFGDFKRPKKAVYRRAKAKAGSKLFSADEIRTLLDASCVQMKAMILLGVNCGFNPSDCGQLQVTALDLVGGWLNFPRPKTGIGRKCPLWSETVEALQAALDVRKSADDTLVFRTKRGQSWYRDSKAAPLSAEFRKLCQSVGLYQEGRGFYSLRRCLQAIGDDHGDSLATKFLMGHSDDSMSDAYRENFPKHRLQTVVNHVRGWLFASEKVES